MFVRRFGFAEKMFNLRFARRNPDNLFFSEDDCHPTLKLYSFTNNGWSLRLLEKTWQQLFL